MKRRHLTVAVTSLVLVAFVTRVSAHGAGLRSAGRETIETPLWLFLLTGGGVVAVSFLLASFVTDRRLIESLHTWHISFSVGETVVRVATG
ncbi:MAG: hypothetical protein SXQ77_02035, partial [Halobacteria archaeon]|nr:hypothetical protein [Halobacteria archaeon]